MNERAAQSGEGAKPALRHDEIVQDKWGANHTRGNLAVGGRLWLTTQRLIFVPNWFERLLRRSRWECELRDVEEVSTAPRGSHPWSGAWRRRLLVRHSDLVEMFVVNRVERIADAITDSIATA